MTKTSEANIWSAQVPAGSSVVFNGTGGQTVDVLNVQDKHLYKGTSAKDSQDHNQVTDAGEYSGGGGGGGVTAPSQLYILGNIEGKQWTPDSGVEMTRQGDTFVANNVKFVTASPTETNVYFNLTDALGADWDALNMAANRYGAASEGVMLTSGSPAPITAYLNNVDASGCLSWALAPGTYNIVADFAAMTVTVTDVNSGVSVVESLESAPIYYNLQGQRVVNPTQGIYIKVTGTKATKVHF